MKHRHFISKLDSKRIEAAIREAELATSGEICVIIHHQPVGDAVAVAREEFVRRGLPKTRHRNAVLILVAPISQRFAVIGDKAVHEQCGDAFWQEMAAAMAAFFQKGQFTEGLVQGIAKAGSLLARHFPRKADDTNQLSDQLIEQ